MICTMIINISLSQHFMFVYIHHKFFLPIFIGCYKKFLLNALFFAKALNKFKEEIIKKYVTIVDWDELDNLLKACKDEGPKEVLEQLKINSIDEKINNPIDETQDLNPSELSGGGDSAGGDFGSSDDFGGSDFGGDDLGDFS